MLPKISILIPTLGREDGLNRCLHSIKTSTYPQELIEIIVIAGVEQTVPQKVASGLQDATGEYIIFASNDLEFMPDCIKTAVEESQKMNKAVVAFKDQNQTIEDAYGGNLCCHFLIRKDFIYDKLDGQIFDTRLYHCGCDNLLYIKATHYNQFYKSDKAWCIHYHFSSKIPSEFDAVYQKGWEHVEEDRKMLHHLIQEFNSKTLTKL